MSVYVVLDTNVLVASMLSRHNDSATKRIIEAVTDMKITALYSQEMFDEYHRVLTYKKFGFSHDDVQHMENVITTFGVRAGRVQSDEVFPDKDDAVFYEVALSKEGAYLVTGNTRHFPVKPIVVTPTEMVAILEDMGLINRL